MDREKQSDKLLYHELDSIKPRVSRQERLGLRPCKDCRPDVLGRVRQQTRFSYYFFLVLMLIGFAVLMYQNNKIKNTDSSYSLQHKIDEHEGITSSLSLIDQEDRYGISILLRNNKKEEYYIDSIRLSNSDFSTNLEIRTGIASDKIFSQFVKIPKEITDLENLFFEINEEIEREKSRVSRDIRSANKGT